MITTVWLPARPAAAVAVPTYAGPATGTYSISYGHGGAASNIDMKVVLAGAAGVSGVSARAYDCWATGGNDLGPLHCQDLAANPSIPGIGPLPSSFDVAPVTSNITRQSIYPLALPVCPVTMYSSCSSYPTAGTWSIAGAAQGQLAGLTLTCQGAAVGDAESVYDGLKGILIYTDNVVGSCTLG